MTRKVDGELLDSLERYWLEKAPEIAGWRQDYSWQGAGLNAALAWRNATEAAINSEVRTIGFLSKTLFDRVMVWGFGSPSRLSGRDIADATSRAFRALATDDLLGAVVSLVRLDGIGISRASKVVALSNQTQYGIYDSRAAHGLSDLTIHGRRVVPIPPSRSNKFKYDYGDNLHFCEAFTTYTAVLRFLRDKARRNPELSSDFSRAADVEMALFARSRNGLIQS